MKMSELRQKMPKIFEQVKYDVEKEIGRHRAGLTLGLVKMGMYHGNFIGGMFFSGGTMIIMNSDPLYILLEEQPDEVILAYVYHILLHEYIHSLGFLNEQQCREIVLQISKNVFKDLEDPALVLAVKGIGAYFPKLHLIYAPPGFDPQQGWYIERIKNFDRGSFQAFYS